jgi:hypothetical protein
MSLSDTNEALVLELRERMARVAAKAPASGAMARVFANVRALHQAGVRHPMARTLLEETLAIVKGLEARP